MNEKTPRLDGPELEDVASANELTGAAPAFIPEKGKDKAARKKRTAKSTEDFFRLPSEPGRARAPSPAAG